MRGLPFAALWLVACGASSEPAPVPAAEPVIEAPVQAAPSAEPIARPARLRGRAYRRPAAMASTRPCAAKGAVR